MSLAAAAAAWVEVCHSLQPLLPLQSLQPLQSPQGRRMAVNHSDAGTPRRSIKGRRYATTRATTRRSSASRCTIDLREKAHRGPCGEGLGAAALRACVVLCAARTEWPPAAVTSPSLCLLSLAHSCHSRTASLNYLDALGRRCAGGMRCTMLSSRRSAGGSGGHETRRRSRGARPPGGATLGSWIHAYRLRLFSISKRRSTATIGYIAVPVRSAAGSAARRPKYVK